MNNDKPKSYCNSIKIFVRFSIIPESISFWCSPHKISLLLFNSAIFVCFQLDDILKWNAFLRLEVSVANCKYNCNLIEWDLPLDLDVRDYL